MAPQLRRKLLKPRQFGDSVTLKVGQRSTFILCAHRRTFFDRKQPWDTAVCRDKAWTNFLFTNNQLANGGCYNTSWSLAVQMQFYAVLPLALVMLRPRAPAFRCAAEHVMVFHVFHSSWDKFPLALLRHPPCVCNPTARNKDI